MGSTKATDHGLRDRREAMRLRRFGEARRETDAAVVPGTSRRVSTPSSEIRKARAAMVPRRLRSAWSVTRESAVPVQPWPTVA